MKLCIREKKTGLYGRSIFKFGSTWEGKELPAHSFTPGDIAGIGPSHGNIFECVTSGIVTQVNRFSVSVAFDDVPENINDDDTTSFKLVKLANDVTYTRLKRSVPHGL